MDPRCSTTSARGRARAVALPTEPLGVARARDAHWKRRHAATTMRLPCAALCACLLGLDVADGLTATSLSSSKSMVEVREGETESLALQLTHELGEYEDVVLRVIVQPTSAFSVEPLRECFGC